MNLKSRYVVKGIKKEQTIASVVSIQTTADGSKIEKVEDKWDGKLPDSSIQNVSFAQLFSVWWWLHYWESWVWRAWSLVWWTTPWMVGVQCGRLNMIAD